jgi:hypothetical protein
MALAYQRKKLSDMSDIGQPGPLPADLVGLTDDVLENLPAALSPEALEQLGYDDQGFFAVDDPPPPPQVVISPYDLLMLFTTPERVAIRTAAKASAAIEDWLDLLNHVPAVHLDDPETIAGVRALEAGGLIAQGRAGQILANKKP